MAFEYGSKQVEIPNPFKFAGRVVAVRGGAMIILGIAALLGVRGLVDAGNRDLGFVRAALGALLLLNGCYAVYWGLLHVFRFYVGREQPADLAARVDVASSVTPGNSTGAQTVGRPAYGGAQLYKMLTAHSNQTFIEPVGFLPRMLHSMVPGLLFLHWEFRRDVGSRFSALAFTALILSLLALAWFSGATGLTPLSGTPVLSWLVVVSTFLLFGVWRSVGTERPPKWLSGAGPGRIALYTGVAVAAPYILLKVHESSPLPATSFSTLPWFVALLVGGVAVFGYSLWLANSRVPASAPPTIVSEYRDHWQESVHPSDIFRAIEMTLTRFRLRDVPNRPYHHRVPTLTMAGGENKGSFEGQTLQETQPEPVKHHADDDRLRRGMLLSEGLLAISAVAVFTAAMGIGAWSGTVLYHLAMGGIAFYITGRLIAQTTLRYLAEVEFASDLIAFEVNGTYAESRIATGMAITDSTRSENTIVRSSMSPYLLVSRLITSTIVSRGESNLRHPRLVLAMEENDSLRDAIVSETRSFLRNRQIVASLSSEADLRTAAGFHQMNEVTRARSVPVAGENLISQDGRDDKPLPPGPSQGEGGH